MKSIFSIFKRGLEKTTTKVARTIGSIFTGVKAHSAESFDELEELLIAADFGVPASLRIVGEIRDRYERGAIATNADLARIASETVKDILRQRARAIHTGEPGKPTVILMVGVNGSGKTTTAGKLAYLLTNQGRKVTLAACDTFRAAAVEQLKLWGERTNSQVVASRQGADAAAVAYDAVSSAIARGSDYLIIDTAGRQHNQKALMEELAKMLRIIKKLKPDAPHETLLTIDSSIGTNAIAQAREFAALSGASALVLTKLDGTGKGGAAAAIQDEFKLPILFVGLGEAPDDLQEFSPEHYAEAIFFGDKKD